MMGVAGILGGALALCYSWSRQWKIPSIEDGEQSNTFKAFELDARRGNLLDGYCEPFLVTDLRYCF